MAAPLVRSMVRYSARVRNGYASPSLAADSAERMRRSSTGTCFIANLPPTIAAQMMGSVGVKQAEIAKQETKLRLGKRPFRTPRGNMSTWMRRVQKRSPPTTSHPKAMVGTTMTRRLRACSLRYALGSSTPIAKRPVARTTRMTSRVIWCSCLLQLRGSKTFAT
jgi:hypothetical protein